MIKPKVSIITVVYNAREELQTTLENLASLKYQNKEIIVIDGNSTDGTKSVIEKFSIHINQWISEPDNGLYDAMNKGLRMATGEYVWFINAGDRVYDEYTLDNIFFGQEDEADVYYGDTLIVSATGEHLGLRKKRPPRKLSWYSLRKGMVVCHQSFLVKRAISPWYNTQYRYAADIEWMIEALKKAVSIRNTHLILSIYQEGGISVQNRKESLKERYQIMRLQYGTLLTLWNHLKFIFLSFRPKYRKIRY